MVYVFRKIVCHDECIVRYGVWGGTSGTIYCRLRIGADYDDVISQGMKYMRWIQINCSHPTTDL